MTVTWELDEDVLADLQADADRRGLSIEAVANERLRGQRLSFIGSGASGDKRRDVGDIDDELAAQGFGRD